MATHESLSSQLFTEDECYGPGKLPLATMVRGRSLRLVFCCHLSLSQICERHHSFAICPHSSLYQVTGPRRTFLDQHPSSLHQRLCYRDSWLGRFPSPARSTPSCNPRRLKPCAAFPPLVTQRTSRSGANRRSRNQNIR